jgi:hypothetical protein
MARCSTSPLAWVGARHRRARLRSPPCPSSRSNITRFSRDCHPEESAPTPFYFAFASVRTRRLTQRRISAVGPTTKVSSCARPRARLHSKSAKTSPADKHFKFAQRPKEAHYPCKNPAAEGSTPRAEHRTPTGEIAAKIPGRVTDSKHTGCALFKVGAAQVANNTQLAHS